MLCTKPELGFIIRNQILAENSARNENIKSVNCGLKVISVGNLVVAIDQHIGSDSLLTIHLRKSR